MRELKNLEWRRKKKGENKWWGPRQGGKGSYPCFVDEVLGCLGGGGGGGGKGLIMLLKGK